jgi:hypothetical protein
MSNIFVWAGAASSLCSVQCLTVGQPYWRRVRDKGRPAADRSPAYAVPGIQWIAKTKLIKKLEPVANAERDFVNYGSTGP